MEAPKRLSLLCPFVVLNAQQEANKVKRSLHSPRPRHPLDASNLHKNETLSAGVGRDLSVWQAKQIWESFAKFLGKLSVFAAAATRGRFSRG